jgi:hypothetical protein
MNLLQFSDHENGSNRRLQSRRRPIIEDLEGRQLLSGVVADVQKVRDADVILADVQKVRDVANATQVAHIGTAAATGGQFYFRE